MAVDGDAKKRGPYLIKIPYVVSGMKHEFSYQVQLMTPVEVGASPDDIMLLTRNGAGVALSTHMNAAWGFIKPFIPTSALTAQYTLERAQAGTDKTFYVASDELGSAPTGGLFTDSRQLTMTFRSGKSSVARLIFLEGPWTGDLVRPLNADVASVDPAGKLAAFVIAPTSPVLATDASWLVAPVSIADTQNEACYKSRHRS